jgi:hypothetical protein
MEQLTEAELAMGKKVVQQLESLPSKPCSICGILIKSGAAGITTFLKSNDPKLLVKCYTTFRLCSSETGLHPEKDIAGICKECQKKFTGSFEGIRA